jgi:outer membrane protein TolC
MALNWSWRRVVVVGAAGVGLVAGCQSAPPDVRILHTSAVEMTGRPAPVAVVPAAAAEQSRRPAGEYPIDLGLALRLAGVENPTINLAREEVNEALAGELAARVSLLPTLNVGGNFYLHRGVYQNASGQAVDVDRQSLYLGAGSRVTGAGAAAVPGAWLFAHLGDAAFAPLAARQEVSARRSDSQGVLNAVLRDVAVAYLQLVGAEARVEVLRQAETDVGEVVRVTRAFADRGQGRQSDADRAAANAELLHRQMLEAEEERSVAHARLCRLLGLDPAVRLVTPTRAMEPVRLMPEDADAEALTAEAAQRRPEVAAQVAEVQQARTRVRQERARPWLPVVSVGYSGGAFGGGGGANPSAFSPLTGRASFDVGAFWTFENLGVGNRARVHRTSAVLAQEMAGYQAVVNQVRSEVAEAQAEAQSAARQIDLARSAATTAEEGYNLDKQRIGQGQGRPIETLDSLRQLIDSRQDLVRAITAYNVAQFRLYAAVGSDPRTSPTVRTP